MIVSVNLIRHSPFINHYISIQRSKKCTWFTGWSTGSVFITRVAFPFETSCLNTSLKLWDIWWKSRRNRFNTDRWGLVKKNDVVSWSFLLEDDKHTWKVKIWQYWKGLLPKSSKSVVNSQYPNEVKRRRSKSNGTGLTKNTLRGESHFVFVRRGEMEASWMTQSL